MFFFIILLPSTGKNAAIKRHYTFSTKRNTPRSRTPYWLSAANSHTKAQGSTTMYLCGASRVPVCATRSLRKPAEQSVMFSENETISSGSWHTFKKKENKMRNKFHWPLFCRKRAECQLQLLLTVKQKKKHHHSNSLETSPFVIRFALKIETKQGYLLGRLPSEAAIGRIWPLVQLCKWVNMHNY